MPSQQQLRWSQLRVGITVVVAAIVLAVLIFFMSGEIGVFTSKISLLAYFDNTEGLKVGAPVALQGVTIGNVKDVRVVPGRQNDPVQITMRVNTKYQFLLRKDTTATIATAGVLGESFIDLDSKKAKGATVKDGDTLVSANAPGLQDVVRSSQGTLTNLDVLVKRLDRIVQQVETGPGTPGRQSPAQNCAPADDVWLPGLRHHNRHHGFRLSDTGGSHAGPPAGAVVHRRAHDLRRGILVLVLHPGRCRR